MRSPVADDEEASYSDDFDEYEYEDDFEEEEDIEVEEQVSSPPPSTSSDDWAAGERNGSDRDPSPFQTPTETLLPPRTASILMDLVSGRRSRHVRPGRAEEASITYAALLPNIETWALGGDLGGSRAPRGPASVKEGEKGVDEEVFQRYVADRLAIERLTLSMRNYAVDEEEVEGRPLRTSAGLSRMVEVVRRKTADRFSAQRVSDLYDHAHLIADIAESMPR